MIWFIGLAILFIGLGFFIPKRFKLRSGQSGRSGIALAPLEIEFASGNGSGITAHPSQARQLTATTEPISTSATTPKPSNEYNDVPKPSAPAKSSSSVIATLAARFTQKNANVVSVEPAADAAPAANGTTKSRRRERKPAGPSLFATIAQRIHRPAKAQSAVPTAATSAPQPHNLPDPASQHKDEPLIAPPTPEPPADEPVAVIERHTPAPIETTGELAQGQKWANKDFEQSSTIAAAGTDEQINARWESILTEAIERNATAITFRLDDNRADVYFNVDDDIVASAAGEELSSSTYRQLISLLAQLLNLPENAHLADGSFDLDYGEQTIIHCSVTTQGEITNDASANQSQEIRVTLERSAAIISAKPPNPSEPRSDIDALFTEEDQQENKQRDQDVDDHTLNEHLAPHFQQGGVESDEQAPADFSGTPTLDEARRQAIIDAIDSGAVLEEPEDQDPSEEEEPDIPTFGWLSFAGEAAQTMEEPERLKTITMLRSLHEPWCLSVLLAAFDEESPFGLRPAVTEALAHAYPDEQSLKPVYERLLRDNDAPAQERQTANKALARYDTA